MIRAILTDIEGTTTSISFVKDVLFPYSRERLPAFVAEHSGTPEIAALLHEVRALCGMAPDSPQQEVVAQLLRWIDEDSKAPPLKTLQGMLWKDGYQRGELHGHLYEDALRRLREWKQAGLALHVFSSGSVQAQRLLFGYTEEGDLTPWFSGYFDTRTGPKQETGSYRTIAAQIGVSPEDILFLSDAEAELDAARAAGFITCKLVRDGMAGDTSSHPIAQNFDEIRIPACQE